MHSVSEEYKASMRSFSRERSFVKIVMKDSSGNIVFEHVTQGEDSYCTANGIAYDYFQMPLQSAEWKREYDPLGTKLPTEDFTFTLIDGNNLLSPESTEGIWELFENNIICEFWFGYELPNRVEWIKGSRYITDGEAKWSPGNKIGTLAINAHSILYYLDDNYVIDSVQSFRSAVQNAFAQSTLALATNFTLTFSETTEKVIMPEESSSNIKTSQLMQLYAQISCQFLKVDRDGNIIFLEKDIFLLSENIDIKQFINSPPELYRYPALKSLSISSKKVASEPLEEIQNCKFSCSDLGLSNYDPWDIYNYIHGDKIPSDGTSKTYKVYVHLPGAYYNAQITRSLQQNESKDPPDNYGDYNTVEPGTRVHNVELLPDMKTLAFDFTPTSDGDSIVTFFYITGQKYSPESVAVTTNYAITTAGQNCNINLDKTIALDEESILSLQTDAKRFLQLRNYYSGDYRGFPEYDPFDLITVETRKDVFVSALICKQKIKYRGSISGEIEFFQYESEET